MSDFDVRVELCDLDGTVLVDLNDETAGYELVSSDPGSDEEWRSALTASELYVDGDFETASTLGATRYEVIVRVKGSTWPQVESRRKALKTYWATRPSFLLRVTREGVVETYRARRPNSTAPLDTIDLMNNRRVVALSFPVQPNPTVTGV